MVDLAIGIVLLALVTVPGGGLLLNITLVGPLIRAFVSEMSHLIADVARSSSFLVGSLIVILVLGRGS